MIRLASWRHSHCSALSVSRINQIAMGSYLGKFRLVLSSTSVLSILLRYLLGHVPCIDMGEKTPAIYKNIRSFDKSATFNGIKVLRQRSFVVELAILMGVDSGPEEKTSWLMLMNFTTTFHQKPRNFPKGSILAEA